MTVSLPIFRGLPTSLGLVPHVTPNSVPSIIPVLLTLSVLPPFSFARSLVITLGSPRWFMLRSP